MHNRRLTNAREHATKHPPRISERPVREQWKGKEPALGFFLMFLDFLPFFLSLCGGEKSDVSLAFVPAVFTARWDLSGGES